MTIKMIVATDLNGGMGLNNKLPWDCPEDLRYFKEQTLYKTVIMGRKTFESLPTKRGLPNRYNYIITRGEEVDEQNYQTADFETVIGCLFSKSYTDEDVWVIGGKSIYEQLLPYVEEIHHTIIDGVYDCDTFIDTKLWLNDDWKLVGGKDLSESAVVNIYRRNI
jgi:dihydrofolate reductase